MARYVGPACKLCRREGEKLFLKGSRCLTNKCAFERKSYFPGQHGKTRRFKQSDYGLQLREKQKLRRIYGILERQFRKYFRTAEREKGITGDNLLRLLERRLDNVVFRLGMAPSRNAARQLVLHRHFLVNDRIVDIPSYLLKPGDVIQVREKSRRLETIHSSLRQMREGKLVPWLELDKANLTGKFVNIPSRQDIPVNVNESLIVELYSK
ncbi:30S ribosomal protein S4 [candidate division KSB1 bacterium]|nr:MAG: 30S ribosomal protein S4 [candidate division KSB1 bacterium]